MYENETIQFITNRGKNFKQKLIALQHTYCESKSFSNASSKCEDTKQIHPLKTNDDDEDDDDFDFNFNPAKSNLKKRKEKQCLNDLVLKDLIPTRFNLKVKLQENIFKVRIIYDQPFSSQLQNIAECLNIEDEKSLILMHEESMFSFEESPKSLNLSESDVLDCFVMNMKEEEKKSEKKGRGKKRSSKITKKTKKLRYSDSSSEEFSIEYIDVEQNMKVSSLIQQCQALADQAQRNQEASEKINELICKNLNTTEVDNENCMIDNVVETESPQNLITIKFKFEGKIIRIPFDYDDCFWLHMREVYRQFGIKSKGDLIIMHNDRVLSKDETPRLLNLTVIDIIDCFMKPVSKEKENEKEKTDESETDLSYIQIKLRNNLNLKRNVNDIIKIRKDESLLNLMKRYAQLVNCSLEEMIFEFDGERLNGEETANDLDLEDECQIDVLIKK